MVKKHCALHLHPQGSLTLREGVHREMCALGNEEKAKVELCYFVLLAMLPETHRRRGAAAIALCCPEVTAMAFHSSCIYSCDGSRIWTDQVEILERDYI